jgi:hypothetical protein
MKRIENHCRGCATDGYPCLGSACPRTHVEVYYCDKCGDELEEIYDVDDEELCEYCLKEKFRRND